MNKKNWIYISLIIILGIFLRTYHINFGLPHSFTADEPEVSELAIKYTYEIRDVLKNNNFYKLIPISYVYGTFPIYLLTVLLMGFSKLLNIFAMPFDKTTLFVFLRYCNMTFSLLIIPTVTFLYYKIEKDKWGTLFLVFLLSLNWKLIVHAHYVNPDIFLTTLLNLSFLSFYFYLKSNKKTLFTIITGILFGLAIGTKITAGLSLPLFMWVYVHKKDYKGLTGFLLVILGSFIISNPFSVIYREDFLMRLYDMLFKEAGLIFDSVDTNPFKYIFALSLITTLPFLIVSLYGKYKSLKEKHKLFHVFLISNVLLYLIFFSIQSRRVDRWLLPILPIVLMYAAKGTSELKRNLVSFNFSKLLLILVTCYTAFPTLLLFQFKRYTPKAEAYLWMRDNLDPLEPVYVITEEGLDPLNKLQNSKVDKFQVYVSDGAQFFVPQNPKYFKYIVLSSRPLENYKRTKVVDTYPDFANRWQSFEDEILTNSQYRLLKEFTLPKPNLIPLSDVYIFENLDVLPQR